MLAPTCCNTFSSICGCCWTSWRRCWKVGFSRRKSKLPAAPAPAVAPAPPVAPRAAPRPPPWLAAAAASKRLTDSSASPPAGLAVPVAGAGLVAAAACGGAAGCALSGIPCTKLMSISAATRHLGLYILHSRDIPQHGRGCRTPRALHVQSLTSQNPCSPYLKSQPVFLYPT